MKRSAIVLTLGVVVLAGCEADGTGEERLAGEERPRAMPDQTLPPESRVELFRLYPDAKILEVQRVDEADEDYYRVLFLDKAGERRLVRIALDGRIEPLPSAREVEGI